MKRRQFLKNTALLSAVGLIAPSTLLSACRKRNLYADKKFEGNVLIIGAGAAGLYAGYLLKARGINFQIFEAYSKIGGRLAKLDNFADYPIDLGAQWLHGKNNIISDFITNTKTKISLDESDQKYWFNNQLTTSLPQSVDIFEDKKLPDISFKDYAQQKGLGSEYDNIIENIAGDEGTSASRLSVFYKNEEEDNWNSGDDDFKFEQTFFDFYEQHIITPIKGNIVLNTLVTQIDYSGSKINVKDSNFNNYQFDKIIITIPITMLKINIIKFIPPLSSEKIAAFSKIGMDAGMKVYLKFKTKFFDGNIIGGKICAAYADESIGKSGNDHVLLAFIMGEQAEKLTALGPDTAIINALLQELDTMYNGQATANYLDAYIKNWANHPFINGAYSYSTIGMGNAREVAAKSIDNKLFFAGEAMNTNGHHQTVHGAAETGYNAVLAILKSTKK
jgi:monoamine oxidase